MSDVNTLVAKAISAHFKGASAAPAPVAPVVAAPVAAVAKAGEEMFSHVFGYTPRMGDFVVTRVPVSPAVAYLVPKVDGDYVVQKEECARMVAGLEDGDKTLITGPTGSGKSSLVKFIAAKLGRPFIRVNMSGDVQSDALFGSTQVRDGATVWVDGAITEAVTHGAMCLVDEWELMPSEIAMGMQNLLEDDGYLYLKEKAGTSAERTILPAKGFALFFAGNTVGQGDTTGAFSGVGVQNTATIDRFTNTVKLDYLSAKHEVDIITSKTNVDKATATKMVKVAALVRNAYNQQKLGLTMSPRTLINWGRKQQRYGVAFALEVSFLEKMLDDDAKSVRELFTKVFGA
jgi:cobaltochelatase CobS